MTDFCKHGYSVQLQNQTFFFVFRIEQRKVGPDTILTLFYSALRKVNLEKFYCTFKDFKVLSKLIQSKICKVIVRSKSKSTYSAIKSLRESDFAKWFFEKNWNLCKEFFSNSVYSYLWYMGWFLKRKYRCTFTNNRS